MRMFSLTILLLAAVPCMAHASWPWGPLAGVPVCTEVGAQYGTRVCADGSGGAYVAWVDCRSDCGFYAQHLDAQGARTWGTGGVPLAAPGGSPSVEAVVRDGSGGAIVVWRTGAFALGAQRVDAGGTPMWTPGGGALGTSAPLPTSGSAFEADGLGGLYAAWIVWVWEWGPYYHYELRAQHLAPDGSLLWSSSGLLLASQPSLQSLVSVADGAGGVVLAWTQAGRSGHEGLRAQRLAPDGSLLWGNSAVVNSATPHGSVAIARIGDGGAFLAWGWTDLAQIFYLSAQRLDAGGATKWSAPGPMLAFFQLPPSFDYHPVAVATPGGDFVVGWRAVDGSGMLFTQRLSAGGAKAWSLYGNPSCAGLPPGDPWPGRGLSVTEDGAGGAYYCFMPAGEAVGSVLSEVRGAHVSATGTAEWGPNGVLVAGGTGGHLDPALASDGNGNAIVSYTGGDDVFAQLLHPDGTLGDILLGVPPDPRTGARFAVSPNPARGAVRFAFTTVAAARVRLEIVDALGRRVCALLDAELPGGTHEATWDGRDALGRAVPAGLYYASFEGAGERVAKRLVLVR
jgi:hypothetical protein